MKRRPSRTRSLVSDQPPGSAELYFFVRRHQLRPQRPRKHKDPTFWFEAQDKGDSEFVGSLSLFCLLGSINMSDSRAVSRMDMHMLLMMQTLHDFIY